MTADDSPGIAGPAVGRERSELLDALRGFALFGVLLVNLRSLSLYVLLPKAERAGLPTAAFDQVLNTAMAALVDGTAITLFSLLFGVGFALQMQRAGGSPDGVRRYVRRLAILFAIGMAHAWLLWWGDILRYYALLGLLLIPLWRLPTAALAAVGVAVVVVLPVLLQPVLPGLLPPQIGAAESAARSLAAFDSGQWSVMLAGNLERDLRLRIAVWVLPSYVFGRLLVGAALGRSGVLQYPQQHLRFWRRLCLAMLAVGGGIAVFLLLHGQGVLDAASPWLKSGPGKTLLGLLRNAAPLALGLLYLAGFVLLFQRPGWRRRLAWLAPVGRMALSNYLAQTVVAIALFYGVGLGIGPRFGVVGTVVACVAIFALQAIASAWWLARWRFGPMEWLWRSLTYGRWQPMRPHREAVAACS